MNRRQIMASLAGIAVGAGIRTVNASTPDRGMVEGRYYCERCDRDIAIPTQRTHPDHAVADLGDFGRVWLDGELISDSCKEAMPGRSGWVVVDRWGMEGPECHYLDFACPDCLSMQVYLIKGNVVFERAA